MKDETCIAFGLTTVLSRVRLQRSFDLPIAPRNIPSWILLLHVRSHPTRCRHVNIRCTTVPRAMVRLNHTDVIVRWLSQTPRSSARTQTEPSGGGLCRAETNAIRIRNRFVSVSPNFFEICRRGVKWIAVLRIGRSTMTASILVKWYYPGKRSRALLESNPTRDNRVWAGE